VPLLVEFSPTVLLIASGGVAGGCVIAALALLRHLSQLEQRLRKVEALTVEQRRPKAMLAAVERLASRLTPLAYRQGLHDRLIHAHLSDQTTPEQIILLTIAGAIVCAALTALSANPSFGAALFPLYVALATVLAAVWLDRRAVRRRQAVQNSLPATLDLLVLAMEAGLSLDAAIREVVAEWHSAASRELERVPTLTQLGMSRGEALHDIAEALDLETLRRLAGRVSAAERLGSSVVLILRAEAEEARRERRTIAGRKISQAPTKILIPTALLILPVTLIVLLGPALPQVVNIVGG
jgi:tight adherence protein C